MGPEANYLAPGQVRYKSKCKTGVHGGYSSLFDLRRDVCGEAVLFLPFQREQFCTVYFVKHRKGAIFIQASKFNTIQSMSPFGMLSRTGPGPPDRSFMTMYHDLQKCPGDVVLLVLTTERHVFGAFSSDQGPLRGHPANAIC